MTALVLEKVKNISPALWFAIIVPVGLFLFMLIADRPFPDFMPGMTQYELHFAEVTQEIFLLIAFIFAVRILRDKELTLPRWLKIWVGLGALGVLYTLLEEMSYGQHYFNWDTPEYWAEINRQEETNLHNINSWFNQKPRQLLEAGVILGGIIAPLLYYFRPQKLERLPEKLRLILPHPLLLTTALLAILPRMYERIVSAAGMDDWHLFLRTSEVQELYFYYFALLYFAFLHRRLRAQS